MRVRSLRFSDTARLDEVFYHNEGGNLSCGETVPPEDYLRGRAFPAIAFKAVPLHALRCFEGFGDDREEI